MMHIDDMNKAASMGLMGLLEIVFTAAGEKSLEAEMPVTERILQPAGVVHGGAMIALAESVGSAASFLLVDPERKLVFGNTINSQHVFPATQGTLHARAELVHAAEFKHVWDVEIRDDEGSLLSLSRITNSIKDRREHR